MNRRLTRRSFVGRTAAAGITVSGLLGVRMPASVRAESYPRVAGWVYDRHLVKRTSSAASEQVLWTTLMRVDNKIANPIDRWYLWHSTHDAHNFRLYSAPNVRGPYTERACSWPNPPSGYQTHPPAHGLSAGDVVWEPPYLYTTPHGAVADGSSHVTFLLRSTNGQTWEYVTTTPILRAGAGDSFDNFAPTYARVLRDFDGRIVRFGGKAVMFYRGERHPVANRANKRFTVGCATSTDLVNWTKVGSGPLFDPLNGALHAIGSAIWQPDERFVYLTVSVADIFFPANMYLKKALTPGSFTAWDDGPGGFIYQSASLFADGGSYVRTLEGHFMTMSAGAPETGFPAVELAQNLIK